MGRWRRSSCSGLLHTVSAKGLCSHGAQHGLRCVTDEPLTLACRRKACRRSLKDSEGDNVALRVSFRTIAFIISLHLETAWGFSFVRHLSRSSCVFWPSIDNTGSSSNPAYLAPSALISGRRIRSGSRSINASALAASISSGLISPDLIRGAARLNQDAIGLLPKKRRKSSAVHRSFKMFLAITSWPAAFSACI